MIPVYEAIFRDDDDTGAYAISLVSDPAMQDFWVTLSKEEQQTIKEEVIEFAAVDDKKNLLLGAVLIPDKKIYRNQGGKEFYMQFTKDTIGKIAHDFIKKGNQNNSTLEHDVKSLDVSFVETWQVADSKVDKSALYGKEYPVGSWVTMAKVSDEIYKEAQDGTFNGFSIEALFGLEKVNLKTEIKMTEENHKSIVTDVIDGVKALFTSNKVDEEKKVETVELMDEPTEAPADEPKEEFVTMAQFNELVEMVRKLQGGEAEEAKEELALSEQELAKDAKIKELELELSKQPETETVVITPEVKVDFKDMTNVEKMLFKRQNG